MSDTTLPSSTPAAPSLRRRPLAPLPRFGLVLLTWGLIALAQPGLLRPDGHGHLAFFAIGPWAFAASRTGRRAFLAEWAAHSLGLAAVFVWMTAFMPALLAPMSIVPALYPALAGVALRRASRWPLALLAPAAWVLAEVLRWSLPVPLSFGWFRLGMLMHDTEWIVGSAAWLGTWGLSWGMAALGGLGADLFLAITRPAGTRYPVVAAVVFGLAPLAGLVALSQKGRAEALRGVIDGPDVLVVQPGISQEIKASRTDPFTGRFVPQVTRTLQALYETRSKEAADGAAGASAGGLGAQPDLVLWGETFLPGKIASPEVVEAFGRGAMPADWAWRYDQPLNLEFLRSQDAFTAELAGALFGQSQNPGYWKDAFAAGVAVDWAERVVRREPLLPPGTSFMSGVEAWTVIQDDDVGGEALRSLNAVGLWSADGRRSEVASKVHLVPGGETGEPLRAIPFVLDAVKKVANAIPDFVAVGSTQTLNLLTRDGASYRMGVTVCFDNAFDDPYTTPLRDGAVDFFVIASNEAWYKDSPLMDHMLAFTRIAAASTHRSIVRATNSGISCVVDPSGRVTEILEIQVASGEGGNKRRKMVSGALRARVPVKDPSIRWSSSGLGGSDTAASASSAVPTTFFTGAEPWLRWALAGLAAVLLALAGALSPRIEPNPNEAR